MSIRRILHCPALWAMVLAATPTHASATLDVRARGEISASIGANEPGYAWRDEAGGPAGSNPVHDFAARFGADGVRFDAGWGLALESWRCGAHLERARDTTPSRRDNAIEYRRGALREWFVNGPFGLQHGLTFDALPAACRESPLVVRYRFTGDRAARQAAPDRIELDGQRYAGLVAWDALDRRPAARMRYDDATRALEITVDARGARAPLVIDPFVQSTRLASGDPGADLYGVRVAVSGDTVVVGAQRSDRPGIPDAGSAYVFVRNDTGWVREAILLASDGASGDGFGLGVALSRDVAVIGAFTDDGAGGADQGAAYVFERAAGSWTQRQKLVAPDGAAGDVFGNSVATTFNGDIIAIGSFGAAQGANADQGKVYLYRRNGATWEPIETLTAPDGAAGDGFGSSVALSGGTLVAGALNDDVGANVDQGSAYVFVGDSLDFAFQQKLVASDGAAGDGFGEMVGASGDDAIVGATRDDLPGGVDQGSAYVYARSGTTWSQRQQLTFPSPASGDAAGFGVVISDGYVAIGGYGRDAGGADSGQIAIFRRVSGVWQLEDATGPTDPVAGRLFGAGLALEGGRLVVGGPGGPDGGAAYVFENDSPIGDSGAGDSADPDGTTDDQTGASVATAIDLMAVGAPEVDGTGVVYLYRLKGTNATTPGCGTNLDSELVATLTNTNGIGDKFGAAVSMSSDGNTIVIGAPQFNARGRVAVFTKPPAGWTGNIDITTADTIAPALISGDKFGTSVAIAEDGTIAAGAPGNDAQGTDAGAVMTFRPVSNAYDDIAEGTAVSMAPQNGASFGSSLSLANGSLIVGAPLEDNLSPGSVLIPDAGAAYAFNVAGSGLPTAQGAIEPLNGGGIGDKFGTSVGVSGQMMVVGAPGVDTASGVDSGAAFVFQDGVGPPQLAATLVPEDGAGQQAGNAVSIAGEYVLLGAPFADSGEMDGEGTSYFYEEPEGGWSNGPPPQLAAERAKVLAGGTSAFLPNTRVSPIKRQPDQAFGSAIGLSRRGLAVGAPLRDDDIPNCSTDIVDEGGADAYLFDRVLRDGFE